MKFYKLLLIALIVVPAVITVHADDDADIDDVDDVEDIDDMDVDSVGDGLDEDEESEEPDDLEENEMDEDEDMEELEASQDAETTVLMIDTEDSEFPAGKTATAVIGFHNVGSRAFFVSHVEGSFRFPQDFRYHMQNFSVIEVNTTVLAGEQATFLYKFTPHESFDPRDIGLVINVHYINEDESFFLDAVFNDTISISEGDTTISSSTIISYVVGLVALLAGYKYFTETPSSGFSPVETGTDADADSEWLTEVQQSNKRKSRKTSTK